MNILQVQDQLKNLSQDQLVREMQMPSGNAPQFLVLSEIMRRKRMEDAYAAQQAQETQGTVADDAIAAAGVPQAGISGMARALAPSTDMVANTGAQQAPVSPEMVQPSGIASMAPAAPQVPGMYAGGPVKKMFNGGVAASDPAVIAMANREGMSVSEYLRSLGEDRANVIEADAARRADRNRMMAMEPVGDSITMPTQADLDARFRQSQRAEPVFPDSGFSQPAPAQQAMTYGRPLYQTLAGRTGTLLPTDQIDLDLTLPDMGDIREGMRKFERDYTTTTEDFTGPITEFFSKPDETIRTIDPYTGKYMDVPTLGTQVRRAGNAVAGLVSDLPTFDLSSGNPYSELSQEEMDALAGGTMSPEAADALQSSRLAMQQFGRGTSGSMTGASPVEEVGVGAPESAQPENTTTPAETVATQGVVVTPDAPVGGGIRSGAGAASGAGGIGGTTSYEQELINAMQRAERRAEQDKWLSLAQFGLGLMSSTQPTFGQALGEAGISGLKSFREARDTYEQERLGLSKELSGIKAARASQRAASAKARSGPSIKDISDRLELITTDELDSLGNKTGKRVPISDKYAGAVAQYEQMLLGMMGAEVAPTM